MHKYSAVAVSPVQVLKTSKQAVCYFPRKVREPVVEEAQDHLSWLNARSLSNQKVVRHLDQIGAKHPEADRNKMKTRESLKQLVKSHRLAALQ